LFFKTKPPQSTSLGSSTLPLVEFLASAHKDPAKRDLKTPICNVPEKPAELLRPLSKYEEVITL
jgi:hypothetical protein